MTPEQEELRAKAIEAMELAFVWNHNPQNLTIGMTAAFDALNGEFIVNAKHKLTNEQLLCVQSYYEEPLTAYEIIALAGDLTKAKNS